MNPHVLLIEDDLDIARLLELDLTEAGYQVTLAMSVMDGLTKARELTPDLLITDLGLPDGDGRDVVIRLRKNNSLPIIVLTARDEVSEKVALLEAGADDYIVKPFSIAELLARIAVQLRSSPQQLLTAGVLTLYPDKRLALLADHELRLSPREFDLLALLLQEPGRVYTRAEVIKALWQDTLPSESNVVDVHFANIRAKFREHEVYRLLRTVRGVGYALNA